MDFIVGTDRINGSSTDIARLNQFCDALKQKGHTVTNAGRSPGVVQTKSLHETHDVMIQIAGGKCLGTLIDFMKGIKKGYYHAKKGAIVYYNCYDPNWKAVRAHDDTFSSAADIAAYSGKTLKEIYSANTDTLIGLAYGDTNDSLIQSFLSVLNGGSTDSNSTENTSSGGSALDLIKQVMKPWNEIGADIQLKGAKLIVKRSSTAKFEKLDEKDFVLDSVAVEDYTPETPNTLKIKKKTIKDDFLIKRFGTVEATNVTAPDKKENIDIWMQDQFQIAQRGFGHTIDIKCLIYPFLKIGIWVKINIPSLNITNKFYYISKIAYDEENTMSLTLDIAPPDLKYEVATAVSTTASSTGNSGLVTVNGNDCGKDNSTWTPRSNSASAMEQNSQTKIGNSTANYAKDTKSMTAEQAIKGIKHHYKYYENNRTCPQKLWNPSGVIHANCADLARLVKCICDTHGVKCAIYHAPSHYFNYVYLNGKWESVDLTTGNNNRWRGGAMRNTAGWQGGYV